MLKIVTLKPREADLYGTWVAGVSSKEQTGCKREIAKPPLFFMNLKFSHMDVPTGQGKDTQFKAYFEAEMAQSALRTRELIRILTD